MSRTLVVIVEETDEEAATLKYKNDPTLEIKTARLNFESFGNIPNLLGIRPTNWVMVLQKKPA
ncbi:MAG: hypothetical protein WC460_02475 [Patescibacteria group bacterium]